MRSLKLALAAIAVASVPAATSPQAATAAPPSEAPVMAEFEGRTINLAEGWGDATACTSNGASTRCYRTEAEMDAAEPGDAVEMASCSSSLRLYSSTGYGGSVLALSQRGTYINLWTYGFDNVTSSYKVGACSSTFYAGAYGGTPVYPGYTGAWASASSMLSAWNNRVSSVYIS